MRYVNTKKNQTSTLSFNYKKKTNSLKFIIVIYINVHVYPIVRHCGIQYIYTVLPRQLCTQLMVKGQHSMRFDHYTYIFNIYIIKYVIVMINVSGRRLEKKKTVF